MAKKEVELKLKINGEQAANSIEGIKKQIADLDAQISKTSLTDPGFGKLVKESEKAKNALGVLEKDGAKGLSGLSGKLNLFKGSLEGLPGPIGGVAQGFFGMASAAKAFIATPIGLIIAGLVAVFKVFQKGIESSEKAQQGLNKIMGAFNGIIGPIIKGIGLLAETLINGVVFAIDAVMSGLEKLGVDFATTAKDGMALADTLNQIEEAEGDLEVARAQQNKTLAEAKEILSDTNKTYEERKKALDDIRVAEEALAAQEVDLAKKQVAAAQENIRLYGASKEANDKLDAARIKLANTEEAFAAKKRQFNKEEKKLISEVEAKEKEAAAAADARRKEAAAKAKQYAEDRIAESKRLAQAIIDIDYYEMVSMGANREAEFQKSLKMEKNAYAISLAELKKDLKDKKIGRETYQKELENLDISHKNRLGNINTDYQNKIKEDQKKFDEFSYTDADKRKEREKADLKQKYEELRTTQLGGIAIIEDLVIASAERTKARGLEVKDKEILELALKLKAAKEAYAKQNAEIDAKYAKEAADKAKEASDTALAEQEKRISAANLALEKGLNDGTIKIEEEEAKRRELEINALNEKIAILKKNGQDTVQAEAELYAKLNEYREKDVADEEAAAKKKSDFRKQLVTESIQGASDLVSAVGSIQEGQMQAELMAAGDNLEKQEAIKKEYFEKNKKVQIAQAIIGAIQGAVGAFTSMSSIPIVGPILAGIAAAAALAAGYANVQKIRATSYEGAAGGGGAPAAAPSKFAQGGLLTGRKHAEGGMATPFGELEGGEYVINREATASFLPLLDRINSMGSGSGAPNNLSATAETGNTSQPVIKAYVVASDMTSQQEANKRIADMARL